MIVTQHSNQSSITYETTFTDLSSDADIIEVNELGIVDSMGWTNRCENGHILSHSADGKQTSDIWIDASGRYIEAFGGVKMIQCSPESQNASFYD